MTIEEKAANAWQNYDCGTNCIYHITTFKDGYMLGASEQKEQLITKACEFLEKAIPPFIDIIGDIIDRDAIIEQLRKAMEEEL